MLPVIVFDDVTQWATDFLRAALAARPELYAQDVAVDRRPPAIRHDRVVTARRDGGRRLDAVREAPRLGVSVWGRTDAEVSDLARLVAALLWSAPNGRPVCKVSQTSGPSPVSDSRPRLYMTFELIVRGSDLLTAP